MTPKIIASQGLNLQPSGYESDALPMCHICLIKCEIEFDILLALIPDCLPRDSRKRGDMGSKCTGCEVLQGSGNTEQCKQACCTGELSLVKLLKLQ